MYKLEINVGDIIAYRVCSDVDCGQMCATIANLLSQGWLPFMQPFAANGRIYQAFVMVAQ